MENPYGASVAENVRRFRREKGLSLADLSTLVAEAGRPLSLQVLSKIERGDRGIDVDDLMALATALEVEPADLLNPRASVRQHLLKVLSARVESVMARQFVVENELEYLKEQRAAIAADVLRWVEEDEEMAPLVQELMPWLFEEGDNGER